MDLNYPQELSYHPGHMWYRDNGTCGITFYAQQQLGEVMFLDLPQVGDKVRAGVAFASIESAKAVSDLVAPVDGEIVEVNELLEEQPALVNTSPYASGWIVKIEARDTANLISAEAYLASISS